MEISAKRKVRSVPHHESYADSLIGKTYLLKLWAIKNELSHNSSKRKYETFFNEKDAQPH